MTSFLYISCLVFTRISLQLDMEELKLNPTYIRLNSKSRLYGLDIPIIGLTGGIATGKSSASKILRQLGASIIDADRLIKHIYSLPQTMSFLRSISPESISGNHINFQYLREQFFKHRDLKSQLENFLYSKLPKAFEHFLKELKDPEFIIYDVPLLFEKKLESKIDITVLIYAPKETQLERIIKRDGCSLDTANNILLAQDPIDSKRSKADFCIDNLDSLKELELKVTELKNHLFQNLP